jgi:hypothetical protein
MEVYAPGQRVMIADGTIPATIVCAAIYAHGGVLYEVGWWLEGDYHSTWLSDKLFTAEHAKVGIGFKSMNGVGMVGA